MLYGPAALQPCRVLGLLLIIQYVCINQLTEH